MLGTSLSRMIDMLRAELRESTNPALGQNFRDTLVQVLQRTQETMWDGHNWPHLRVTRYIVLAAGQRFYALPDDLPWWRITDVRARQSSQWLPIIYGIDAVNLNIRDSDSDARTDPVRNWRISEDAQIEVWPLPASTGTSTTDPRLRLEGIRKLAPLVADSDTADLDDRCIVLFAAAEILQGNKDTIPLGKAKAGIASQLLERLQGRMRGPRPTIQYGGSIGAPGGNQRDPRFSPLLATWRP